MLSYYHMIGSLKENVSMAVVVVHGVLFRKGNEEKIREYLVENNYLDAVIGLPDKLLYDTNISTTILIFKKNRVQKNILFIDASN
jgi:type I restriction enzyme M protein